jgi:hypothetical protein
MPGTVSEVSATLVASTMRRPEWVSNTRSWSACDKRENKRQHFGPPRDGAVGQVLAQMVRCLSYFTLAGQEDQDVAGGIA